MSVWLKSIHISGKNYCFLCLGETATYSCEVRTMSWNTASLYSAPFAAAAPTVPSYLPLCFREKSKVTSFSAWITISNPVFLYYSLPRVFSVFILVPILIIQSLRKTTPYRQSFVRARPFLKHGDSFDFLCAVDASGQQTYSRMVCKFKRFV